MKVGRFSQDGELNFKKYLDEKNKQYAKTCRHFGNDVCYMNDMYEQQYGDLEIQCPCNMYEERKLCTGCVASNDRKDLRCFKPHMCYRCCFNPEVPTKDLEDKYERK